MKTNTRTRLDHAAVNTAAHCPGDTVRGATQSDDPRDPPDTPPDPPDPPNPKDPPDTPPDPPHPPNPPARPPSA